MPKKFTDEQLLILRRLVSGNQPFPSIQEERMKNIPNPLAILFTSPARYMRTGGPSTRLPCICGNSRFFSQTILLMCISFLLIDPRYYMHIITYRVFGFPRFVTKSITYQSVLLPYVSEKVLGRRYVEFSLTFFHLLIAGNHGDYVLFGHRLVRPLQKIL